MKMLTGAICSSEIFQLSRAKSGSLAGVSKRVIGLYRDFVPQRGVVMAVATGMEWPGWEGNVTLLPHLVPTQPQCGATVPARSAGRAVRKRIYRWFIGC